MKTKERTTPLLAERRYAGLDGLRAIAVLLVIAFHLLPGVVVGGYLGVDVFFVISGFLITALLLRERKATGGIKLGAFWARRARRLVPALVLLLLVCCAVALAVGGDRLLHLGRQVLGALTFSSNWLGGRRCQRHDRAHRSCSATCGHRGGGAVLPDLALRRAAPRAHPLACAAGRAAPHGGRGLRDRDGAAVQPDGRPDLIYYGTDTHSFGLALGAVLAMLSRDWPLPVLSWPRIPRALLPVLGWAALAGLLVLGGNGGRYRVPYRGGLALTAVLTALVIVGAVVPGSSLGSSLDIQPLRWIGERSYGLYLLALAGVGAGVG